MISGKDNADRAHRLPDAGRSRLPLVYNHLVRAARHRRHGGAQAGVSGRGLPRRDEVAVQIDQHPRRTGHDATQGHDRGAARPGYDDGEGRGIVQCNPEADRTARCSATCSTGPGSRKAVWKHRGGAFVCEERALPRRWRWRRRFGDSGIPGGRARGFDRALHDCSATARLLSLLRRGFSRHYPRLAVRVGLRIPAGCDRRS